ncbi:MAG: modified peptide precursor CbpA [Magnetococcales bacterium]|nr:modified peptide precursor CbpA [Magnetococcales bacterium]MBF0150770.1 modified peptide precursor CbpA [Magnetococcales bacterium]MBF0173290.1 modified peptide precursor CbpA [Magnetococcales bacterium]MBF0348132.1 modified peptide precursor CbpA [Magnetococcales bacterium]MBF0630128.1 modified peptide precursor CbpA [Magnetococcales bacterium]
MNLNANPTAQGSVRAPQTPPSRIEEVITQRKRCSADGVGLSHYILMDRKDK